MRVEVPQEVQEFLKDLSKYEPVEEELLLKQALRSGVALVRREYAIKLFVEDRVSLSEGAKLADLSVGEYMDLLASRGVRSKVTVEEYREGLKSAKTLVKGRQ